MVIVTPNGVAYRTRATSQRDAARLAEALEKNPEIEVWGIIRSERAKGSEDQGWFACWQPRDEGRQQDLVEEQQLLRADRARAEGSRYQFVVDRRDVDGQERTWAFCQSTSGEVYEVTLQGCTCDDWAKVGAAIGVFCKHQWELITRIQRGELATF